jgi:UDP-glucose 4-epimerase
MKVIITGVAGFVGSNLTADLLKNNHSVIGIDNFSYGSISNIQEFLKNPNFQFFEGDLRDYNTISDLKGDVLVHLASQKIPRYSNAFNTIYENSAMTGNVIKKCLSDKIKLVFASTSDVYGKNPDIPYSEESNLVMGATTVKRWAYAISKIHSEHGIIANSAEFGLDYTIMRFFGSYGPNQNTTWWGGPQAVFIQNILENKAIEIHGDGEQTRTFTFVKDTVQGIVKCIFEEKAKNEIFNIASEPDEEITISALAQRIVEMMKKDGYSADLKFIPYETFGNYEDVRRRVPNIDKIKTMLNYKPMYSLNEGLAITIDWQKRMFNNK